jgi:hypothetical protein
LYVLLLSQRLHAVLINPFATVAAADIIVMLQLSTAHLETDPAAAVAAAAATCCCCWSCTLHWTVRHMPLSDIDPELWEPILQNHYVSAGAVRVPVKSRQLMVSLCTLPFTHASSVVGTTVGSRHCL